MTRIRRRTLMLAFAIVAALSISLSLPMPTFAGGVASTTVFVNPEPSGRRCQCGWR